MHKCSISPNIHLWAHSFILSLLTSPYFCSSLIALPFNSAKRDLHDIYLRNFNEWTQHYLGMKPQIQVHIYIRKAFIQKRTFYTDYNSIYHLRLFQEMYFDQVMTVYTYWTAQLSRHNKMILHKRYISWFWGCFWIELCYMIVVFL